MWVFLNTFWRTGLQFSIFFGLFQFFINGGETSLLSIAFAGFFYGAVMGLFAYEKSRKFTKDRPLTADEILIEEGFAEYEGKKGWFYLTNKRFFYISPDEKTNIYSPYQPNGESFSIMFSEILSARTEFKFGVIPRRLILNLTSGQRAEFDVSNTKHVVKQIKRASSLLLKAARN